MGLFFKKLSYLIKQKIPLPGHRYTKIWICSIPYFLDFLLINIREDKYIHIERKVKSFQGIFELFSVDCYIFYKSLKYSHFIDKIKYPSRLLYRMDIQQKLIKSRITNYLPVSYASKYVVSCLFTRTKVARFGNSFKVLAPIYVPVLLRAPSKS